MSEAYFCEKCGYIGKTSEHPNCEYLGIDIHWQEKIITQLRAQVQQLVQAVADHVTVRAEQYQTIQQQAESLRVAREALVSANHWHDFEDAIATIDALPNTGE